MNMYTSREVEKSRSREGSTTYVAVDLSDSLTPRPLARHLSTAMVGLSFVAAMPAFAFAPRLLMPSLVACASLTLLSAVPLLLSVRMKLSGRMNDLLDPSRAKFACPIDNASTSTDRRSTTPTRRSSYLGSPSDPPILAFVSPSLLGAAGFAFMLIVENAAGRAVTALAVLALHASYLSFMTRVDVVPRDFLRIRSAMSLTTLFFTLAFLFGISAFVDVPLIALAFTAGVVAAAAAWSALRHEVPRAVIAAFGALGAETFLALWFLPTAWLVDAAASMILFVLALQVIAHLNDAPAPLFRRRAVFAAALVALVLGTARWA